MKIAVCLPCHNEATAIADVVEAFRQHLPEATIYVFDNASTDDTISVARAAGAVVRRELHKGKGNVVRRMFADVEADVYLLADGDGTYDAGRAREMVDLLVRDNLDMVTGVRVGAMAEAYRPGHRFGNRLLTGIVTRLFGNQISDMLSGYRVFSRRFVKGSIGVS
jgi:glycosyltransferase involved in cell wall biosynthesis